MTKQKMPNSPAAMKDVIGGIEAAVGIAGAVMARVLPIFARHTLTDAQSLDNLKQELEALVDEFEPVSPHRAAFLDAMLHTLDVDADSILAKPTHSA
ncbi:hypothetical protein GIY62_00650 [Burkholderia plantarii]|uniref:hypothetical protein n=1 Tax=Burkholderia plantarii TaxID=41899 RepID=UPI00272B2D84|nr:hypothetical protein [Burkholderia plantarii]WLE59251.1 hypothetical protein GIY62_00650 [Burkholderia plantarii]